MASCGDVFETWRKQRRDIYPRLKKVADDLEKFHQESSKYVCGGTVVRGGGDVLNVFGIMTGRKEVEAGGLLLNVIGGGTVTATQLLQEYKDNVAIQNVTKMLKAHEDTHEDLKKKVAEVFITLPSLDYRQLYFTPDTDKTIGGVSDTMKKALSFYQAIYGSQKEKTSNDKEDKLSKGEKQERAKGKTKSTTDQRAQKSAGNRVKICRNMDKVCMVLKAVKGVLERDMPLFFQSWQTMNGTRVPETVNRLRFLNNDLQSCEDDLHIKFDNMFDSEEFKDALGKNII